jgi:hypothetical protein
MDMQRQRAVGPVGGAPASRGDRREAVRALLFSKETVMRGLAELAVDGGEDVYTSVVSDRFESALSDAFDRDTGPDEFRAAGDWGAPSDEEIANGLNPAYLDDDFGTGWESTEATVDRLLSKAVKSCRSLLPVLGAYRERWETEEWRRDRPGFDASAKSGELAHFHDRLDPSFRNTAFPVIDSRQRDMGSEVSLYPATEGPVRAADHDPATAGTFGYSVGVGPAPRSSMVAPTRAEKSRAYMDAAVFKRLFGNGGQGTDMMGPPLGLGRIRRGGEEGEAATAEDRVDEFLRKQRERGASRSPYAVDGIDSVSVISSGFR